MAPFMNTPSTGVEMRIDTESRQKREKAVRGLSEVGHQTRLETCREKIYNDTAHLWTRENLQNCLNHSKENQCMGFGGCYSSSKTGRSVNRKSLVDLDKRSKFSSNLTCGTSVPRKWRLPKYINSWGGFTNQPALSSVVTTLFLLLSLCVGRTLSGGTAVDSLEPEFSDKIENITVPAGREVKLACSVKNLGPHKVAWIHFEGSAILTVQTHVITRNPRIKVTHDKHRTWYLHIEDVQQTDAGRYMCQINTETAKTQFGYLHVVVPPNIDDSMSSSDVIVRENSNVSLSCHATGSPEPEVKWRREDAGEMRINRSYTVKEWSGETLDLSRISRLDMGAYMCIASNGVPPAVSKRIKVSVDFPPMLWIPHQLIGVPQGFTVTLECTTEAHPASLNYWTREDGHMIHDSRKYRSANEVGTPQYKTHMKLTIIDIQPKDFGTYKCVAKNPRGETEGQIKLYESAPPTTTALPTTTMKITYRRQKGKDQKDVGGSNRNPSSLAIGFTEEGEYSSNMNAVDKSQIRSTKSTAKGGSGGSGGNGGGMASSDWLDEGTSPSSSGRTSSYFIAILISISGHILYLWG